MRKTETPVVKRSLPSWIRSSNLKLQALLLLVILIISAINIAHTYYMIIADRRREIGVMRAVGANRWDIRILFIGEASVLGLIGGTIGLAIGVTIVLLAVLYLAARQFGLVLVSTVFEQFFAIILIGALTRIVSGFLPLPVM